MPEETGVGPSLAELCGILDRAKAALSVGDYWDFLERADSEIAGRIQDPDTLSLARGIEPPRKPAGRFNRGSGA